MKSMYTEIPNEQWRFCSMSCLYLSKRWNWKKNLLQVMKKQHFQTFVSVVQNRITAYWFKNKELALAFGITLAFSRLGSVLNFFLTQNFKDMYGLSWTLWGGNDIIESFQISHLPLLFLIFLDFWARILMSASLYHHRGHALWAGFYLCSGCQFLGQDGGQGPGRWGQLENAVQKAGGYTNFCKYTILGLPLYVL